MVLVVTCWTGTKPCALHPAPTSFKAICFTNNPDLEKECLAKGWMFHLVKVPSPNPKASAGVPPYLMEDPLYLGNLECKYIKFFQFLDDPKIAHLFEGHDTVIYVDQKRRFVDPHVSKALQIHKAGGTPLTMMNNPGVTVAREMTSACKQPRYRRIRQVMRRYLQTKRAQGYAIDGPKATVHYTGLLIFDPSSHYVKSLMTAVFNDIYAWGIIECQVVWGIHEQDYPGLVHSSLWETVGVPMKLRP